MPVSCHAWVGYHGWRRGSGGGGNKDPLAVPHVRVNNMHSPLLSITPGSMHGYNHLNHDFNQCVHL